MVNCILVVFGNMIKFINVLFKNVISYKWEFDGVIKMISIVKNFMVIYCKVGIYNVILIVKNKDG